MKGVIVYMNATVAKVRKVRAEFTEFTRLVQSATATEDVVYELMGMRKYTSEEMYYKLSSMGVFKVDSASDFLLQGIKVSKEQLEDWGLTRNSQFLMTGRFILPIKDVAGNVVAWVGWYPDARKYVTTPTYGFKREVYFFGEENTKECINDRGAIFLVEGIFDTVSLSSLGYNVIGNMGLPLSAYKRKKLHRFGKVIRLPDNDLAGMSTVPYLNDVSGKTQKNMWVIDNENVLGRLPNGIKDIDDYIKIRGNKARLELDKLLSQSITYKLK